MSFDLDCIPSQKGRIAIVTGANIGLGYETALGLAQKEAKVVMACRNLQKAQAARNKITELVPGADLEIMALDLNSLQSVRDFAAAYQAKYQSLDLLIENAGIMVPPIMHTEDGFESQMGVNYFGHFLLTKVLFPLLDKTDGSRVVTLSSVAHRRGIIDFDNLNAENGYTKMVAYSQSKLACLMFAFELQRRIDAAGSSVLAVSAHPGVSPTNLARHIPKALLTLLTPFLLFFVHAPRKAALPILMAALDENVKGGEYYGPTGFREMKGKPGRVESRKLAHNLEVAKRLWEVSEELVQEKFTL